nr:unnamed protein product [Callosobruchus analis]
MARHKSRRKRKRSSSTSSSSSPTGGNENVARGRQRRQRVSSTPVGSASLTTQSYNVQPVSNIIPEFDPKLKDIEDWIEIIKYNANIYQWSDSTITFQALSKLQGTAKMWYDSYIESELGWSQFTWERWKGILVATFKSNRDCYKLFMDLVNHKPANGAINDSNITAAVEASNMSDLNALGSYLKNKINSISATEAPQKHKSEITFNRPSTSGIRHSIASHTANRETICKACGKTGDHRALCRHRNQICNYCKVKGHIESYCLNKNNQHTQTTNAEKNYHSFELELLAIVRSLEKFRYYLIGREFTIFTDCNAVKNAWNKQSIIPRIARWILSLQDFSFNIVHRAGSQMQHVDALSRSFTEENNSQTKQVLVIKENDYFREAQNLDENIKSIRDILLCGDRQQHKDIFNDYDLRGNKAYRVTPFGRRLVVPKNCKWQVVKANHDDIGHFAFDKTVDRIRKTYWFPKMNRFIRKYISSCLPCLYHKERGGKKLGYLHSIPKYARPHHTLHIDHLGPFVESLTGNKYVLTVVDGFSKYTYIKPVPNTSSKHVIEKLEEIFSILGNPKRIITDAGTPLTSNSFKDYCSTKGIKLFTTAVGLPRGNGQAERTNKTILDALATSSSTTEKNNWDSKVQQVQQGINSTKHRITQHSPAELLLGFQLRTDTDLQDIPSEDEQILDVTKIRKQAAKNLERSRVQQNVNFDKHRLPPKMFSVGDLVLTKVTSFPANSESKKLPPKYRAPFKVIEVMPNDRYRVREDIHSERSSRPYEAVVGLEHMKSFQLQQLN